MVLIVYSSLCSILHAHAISGGCEKARMILTEQGSPEKLLKLLLDSALCEAGIT